MLNINIPFIPDKPFFFGGTGKASKGNEELVSWDAWGAGMLPYLKAQQSDNLFSMQEILSLCPCKGVWFPALRPLDDCPEHMRRHSGTKGARRAELDFSCWQCFTLHDNLNPPLNQRWVLSSHLPHTYLRHEARISSLSFWTGKCVTPRGSSSSSLLSMQLSLQTFSRQELQSCAGFCSDCMSSTQTWAVQLGLTLRA